MRTHASRSTTCACCGSARFPRRGLAGARIGYALGAPEIIASFDKIRNHFGINKIGQAGALAALEDDAYLQEVRSRVAAGRARLDNKLELGRQRVQVRRHADSQHGQRSARGRVEEGVCR